MRGVGWGGAREDADAVVGARRAVRGGEAGVRGFGWTDRTRARRDEGGDAMMGGARAFDETMD